MASASVRSFGTPFAEGAGVIFIAEGTLTQSFLSNGPIFASTNAQGFYGGTVTPIGGGSGENVGVGGEAAAFASLASGSLGATAVAGPNVDIGLNALIASLSVDASATARLDDTLDFAVPGALRFAPVFVTMSMRVHGFANSTLPIGAAEMTTSGFATDFTEIPLDAANLKHPLIFCAT